jgi:hypothetical protein
MNNINHLAKQCISLINDEYYMVFTFKIQFKRICKVEYLGYTNEQFVEYYNNLDYKQTIKYWLQYKSPNNYNLNEELQTNSNDYFHSIITKTYNKSAEYSYYYKENAEIIIKQELEEYRKLQQMYHQWNKKREDINKQVLALWQNAQLCEHLYTTRIIECNEPSHTTMNTHIIDMYVTHLFAIIGLYDLPIIIILEYLISKSLNNGTNIYQCTNCSSLNISQNSNDEKTIIMFNYDPQRSIPKIINFDICFPIICNDKKIHLPKELWLNIYSFCNKSSLNSLSMSYLVLSKSNFKFSWNPKKQFIFGGIQGYYLCLSNECQIRHWREYCSSFNIYNIFKKYPGTVYVTPYTLIKPIY